MATEQVGVQFCQPTKSQLGVQLAAAAPVVQQYSSRSRIIVCQKLHIRNVSQTAGWIVLGRLTFFDLNNE